MSTIACIYRARKLSIWTTMNSLYWSRSSGIHSLEARHRGGNNGCIVHKRMKCHQSRTNNNPRSRQANLVSVNNSLAKRKATGTCASSQLTSAQVSRVWWRLVSLVALEHLIKLISSTDSRYKLTSPQRSSRKFAVITVSLSVMALGITLTNRRKI